jgi:hypothetical protein
MVEMFRLPPDLAGAAWRDIAPLLAPAIAMSEGRHTLATTLERIQDRDMRAVVALKDSRPVMACVTQIALYPAQRWLQVPFCGGHGMHDWLGPIVEELDAQAYDAACVGIEISGRGGWKRVLARYGYRPSENHHLLIKRLDSISMEEAA